jgi:CheY-like chemotaxis protein
MTTAERAAPKPDSVRIGEILDRLDASASKTPSGERRKPYRRGKPLATIDHPAGGTARLVAHSRLLWSEGMVLLSAGFTYPGSMFTGTLVSSDGESMGVRGRVVDCRHVEGVYHELEVKFSSRVDVSMFVEPPTDAMGGVTSIDLPNLQGKVLYLDDSEVDARLMAHYLKGSGIELTCVRNPAEALEKLGGGLFDILVTDLNLGGGHDGLPVVAQARAAGFTGPVAVLTAETSQSKLAAVKAAGVDQIVAKPYQRNTLVQAMVKLHQQSGAIGSGEVVYSTLSDQPDIEELLTAYVSDVRKMVQDVQRAIAADDFNAVRDYCLNLRGSATGYGFPPVGTAAEDALRALDGSLSVAESRPKLRTLLLICGQLGVRKKAPPPKPEAERMV